jgi:hypothetical protein
LRTISNTLSTVCVCDRRANLGEMNKNAKYGEGEKTEASANRESKKKKKKCNGQSRRWLVLAKLAQTITQITSVVL